MTNRDHIPPIRECSTMKAYPTPMLKPLYPFLLGAGISFYLFSNVAKSMSQAPAYVNDPRNPYREVKKH